MSEIVFTVPIRLRSEANISEHWSKKHKRKKNQQAIIKLAWQKHVKSKIGLPVAITLVRQAPRTLDYDNLVSAFKWARDAIADIIVPGKAPGRADDTPGMTFHYQQSKEKQHGIQIRIVNDGI